MHNTSHHPAKLDPMMSVRASAHCNHHVSTAPTHLILTNICVLPTERLNVPKFVCFVETATAEAEPKL